MLLNGVLSGGCIPNEWKEVELYRCIREAVRKSYRPVAIINVMCKLFMMVVRERINEWVEGNGMFSDIHGDFRRG